MSGHSHWAGIKHKKEKEDQKKGKVFSRVARQITTAARQGGKDPDANIALKYAMDAAKAAGMPKDTVERAILKGTGELEGQQLESVRYEGYGPGGAAVMVEALTDNRNRTTAKVRKIFSAHGGEMGSGGCVAWTFEMKGLVLVEPGDRSEDDLLELGLEAGADDVQAAGEVYEMSCEPRKTQAIRAALEAGGLKVQSAEVTMVPKAYVDLTVEQGRKIVKLMDEMEEDEDVTSVYSNFNLPPDLVAEIEKA